MEITIYEEILLIIHLSANHLMSSKIIDQVPFFQLVGELDDKWMTLRENYQQSRHLSGLVYLKSPSEIESEKSSEPVSIIILFS